MKTEAIDTNKAIIEEQEPSAQLNEQVNELTEDMEVVSPGAMLLEARKALSLSQEHIAMKLNFKVSLVQNIEDDNFDPALPATFNRGYLTNYAKLVGIETVDVLASYDALDAATIQRSEMLSFSKETTKRAEHSRVMWLSYLIVALLVALTIIWWLQENKQQEQDVFIATPKAETSAEGNQDAINSTTADSSTMTETSEVPPNVNTANNEAEPTLQQEADSVEASKLIDEAASTPETILSESLQEPLPVMSTAVFTFKGDCWVNISDATGERIAWGVKKAGYVMSIQGVAPLKITVGKPELTSITFNDEIVDMSIFNTGNIAKFNLPLAE